MTAYLLSRKVAHGPKWYTSRRQPILAIVTHVTAGLEDLDATADQSAERTAAYAANTDRKVSWHQGTDTDSNLVLLPDSYTAFHVARYNSCTLGREISKRHTDWRTMPAKWITATLGNAAPADAEWCRLHRIPVRKATRRELDNAIALWQRTGDVAPVGFISHAELDPTRRSDPGFVRSVDTFPWHSYLELVRHHLNGTNPQEEDIVFTVAEAADYVRDGYSHIAGRPATEVEVYLWAHAIAADAREMWKLQQRLVGEAIRAKGA